MEQDFGVFDFPPLKKKNKRGENIYNINYIIQISFYLFILFNLYICFPVPRAKPIEHSFEQVAQVLLHKLGQNFHILIITC